MGPRDTGWTGVMGLIYGGARHWLEWGVGIDLWGRIMGVRDWIGEMGLICGGTPWGCYTSWMWAMGLSYVGVPWGCATGSGDGIDLWGRAMGGARH